jgi:hypothetical protein
MKEYLSRTTVEQVIRNIFASEPNTDQNSNLHAKLLGIFTMIPAEELELPSIKDEQCPFCGATLDVSYPTHLTMHNDIKVGLRLDWRAPKDGNRENCESASATR